MKVDEGALCSGNLDLIIKLFDAIPLQSSSYGSIGQDTGNVSGYHRHSKIWIFFNFSFSHKENVAKPKRKAISPQRLFRRSKHKYV